MRTKISLCVFFYIFDVKYYTMYSEEQILQFAKDSQQYLKNDFEIDIENVEELRNVLRFHEYRYYVLNNPLLADTEYDIIYKKLEAFETLHPELITTDSPTQRVGADLTKEFASIAHLVPMLSLENSYNQNDLRDWDKRVKSGSKTDAVEYSVEPKFDGAGISLIYENDRLVRGVTRGDGTVGEDITVNIKQIRSIPLYAPFSKYGIAQIEIRGEVMMSKKSFEQFNEKQTAQGGTILANPRNAASGSLRMKNPKAVAERGLDAFLYNISYYTLSGEKSELLNTHEGCLQLLWECGLRSPQQEQHVYQNIEEVIAHVTDYETLRDTLPYEIDGMVVKVNNVAVQDKLGMTSHHPRWAIAYKFKARQATSVLRSVEFQVGRTGTITPVAKIDSVFIGGVTVSSVSLFNEDVIKEKDLRLGDTVLVERAGDVIPYIVKALTELRKGEEQNIIFPVSCPVCGTELHKPEGEAAWRCINPGCEAQVVERMIHFASKDAMDIRSLGEANIRKFYALQLLSSLPDIYTLDFNKISTLEGFGKRSVDNLRNAVEKSKEQPLHRLIFALGIRYVGENTAKVLAANIQNLWDLKDKTQEDLQQLEDIGPKVAAAIVEFFETPQIIEMLQKLEQLGLQFAKKQTERKEGETPLQGLTFLFTGTLTQMKRSEAEEKVESLGGKILSGVSSKLTYLVAGADAGSKLEKAKKLNSVNIISEQDFLKMITV